MIKASNLLAVLFFYCINGICDDFDTHYNGGSYIVGTNIYSDIPSPVVIRNNIAYATEMRFGNTPREMELATFQPYNARVIWYLPGFNYKTLPIVYGQFRGSKLKTVVLQIPVFQDVAALIPDGNTFPFLKLPDTRSSNVVISQNFDIWNERWATYQDSYGYGNVFYPMTYQRNGGVNDGAFIWTDSSRWNVDPPDRSMLVAVNYWRWLFPPDWRAKTGSGENVDLTNTFLEVYLRIRNLRLGNAYTTFWVLCNGARWHLRNHLVMENGKWKFNSVYLSSDPKHWELSWSRGGKEAKLCLDQVESYGFAIRGFDKDESINGVFEIDEFFLKRKLPLYNQ